MKAEEADTNMKAEEESEKLLKEWEKEIDKPWIDWNKWKFFRYGFQGDFGKIRELINFKKRKPNEDRIEAFIGICDNRIDRIKSHSRDLITFISVSAASFAIALSILIKSNIIEPAETKGYCCYGLPNPLCSIAQKFPVVQWIVSEQELNWVAMKIMMIALFALVILLTLAVWRYRAQINAWYAVKEGVLLMKKNK